MQAPQITLRIGSQTARWMRTPELPGRLFIVGLITLGMIVCSPVSQAAQTAQASAEAEFQKPEVRKRVEAAMLRGIEDNPVFQAIKQVEPAEYKAIRDEALRIYRAGDTFAGTMAKIKLMSEAHRDALLQKRLKRASAATVVDYIQFRLELFERIYASAPDGLYAILASGSPPDPKLVPARVREEFAQSFQKYGPRIAGFISAPLAAKPVPQDENKAAERLAAILQKLSQEEVEAFLMVAEGKSPTNARAFARSFLHVYKEGLKLPPAESAQLFRTLGQVPRDERLPVPAS